MANSTDLQDRLDFIGFDEASRRAIRNTRPVIRQMLPGALDAFYARIAATPETRRFFSSTAQVESAKSRQIAHWERISSGQIDESYVAAVTQVGAVHAKIGLPPRWYIGGYALLLEKLVEGVVKAHWPKRRFGGGGEAGACVGELAALVKAVLLDMDYAISTYLEAAEAQRRQTEAEARAREEALSAERASAVSLITRALSALADGDLTQRIDSMPAEYGQLRDDFNMAMDRLGAMVATIKATSGHIAQSSQEIRTGATDLSARTEQQASSLEETAATTEELAASVKASAGAARQAVLLANEAAGVAQTGGAIVGSAIEAMGRIETSSQKISDITSVIDSIAFQTNLLALNAAVEAARAGDAGRGFAVVASEVRALAQRSADAARDISALIRSSNAEIGQGVELVRSAGASLAKIVEASQNVSTTVSEISAATGEQANGIDEMSQTVAHMDGMTQQNAALSDASAASARLLTEQIEQLNTLVSEFRTEAREQAAGQHARRAA